MSRDEGYVSVVDARLEEDVTLSHNRYHPDLAYVHQAVIGYVT